MMFCTTYPSRTGGPRMVPWKLPAELALWVTRLDAGCHASRPISDMTQTDELVGPRKHARQSMNPGRGQHAFAARQIGVDNPALRMAAKAWHPATAVSAG